MKILLVHQLFADPSQPGGTRHFEFARRLVRRGHEVSVVTSDLCYLTGQPVTARRQWHTSERRDGIEIHRAFTWASLHRSLAWRVVACCSFMLSSLWAGLKSGPCDVVIGTSPPIFQLASAWLIALLRRRPLVVEIRDLWPAFAIDMGVLKNKGLIWLATHIERFFYARARLIIVNSPAYVDYLAQRGVPREKIRLVPNGVDPQPFSATTIEQQSAIRQQFQLQEKFVVTYAGALGRANDLATLLRAAARLRDYANVQFLLVGDGQLRPQLEQQVRDENLANVTIAGSLPKEQMPAVLAASDACLATLLNIPMFRMTYPNKVFDYMAAARPTVLAIDGVIREVLEKARGGICVPPGDDAALAQAVQQLAADPQSAQQMGQAARLYVTENFHRDRQAVQFADALVAATTEVGWSSKSAQRNAELADGLGSPSYVRFKHIFDAVLSAAGLVMLAPLLLAIAVAIWLTQRGPILFRDRRAGLRGRPFDCLKFRTMTDARDEQGRLLADDDRITSLGRWLRATSFDELPQLINVLRGEMSLVGPRPLTIAYLPRYTPAQARRHDVRPGITGWAQVNGRNSISWGRKFELDAWYIEHLSLWLDLKILLQTFVQLLPSRTLQREAAPAASEFLGSSSS